MAQVRGKPKAVVPAGALGFGYVDIIDACSLKCPTCVRGLRLMQNTSAKMSLITSRPSSIK